MSGFRKYDNLPGPGIKGQEKAALTADSYMKLDAAEIHASGMGIKMMELFQNFLDKQHPLAPGRPISAINRLNSLSYQGQPWPHICSSIMVMQEVSDKAKRSRR